MYGLNGINKTNGAFLRQTTNATPQITWEAMVVLLLKISTLSD
jgi:hypothetical protein